MHGVAILLLLYYNAYMLLNINGNTKTTHTSPIVSLLFYHLSDTPVIEWFKIIFHTSEVCKCVSMLCEEFIEILGKSCF